MRRFPGQTFPLFSSFSLPARGFALILTITLAAPFLLASCASPSGGTGGTSGTGQAPTDTATTTPIPQCVQLSPGATPFTGIAGVSGLTLPAGAYITAPIDSGGGDGEYRIATYTVCFQGAATAISGASAGATFTQLQAAGWTFDNLFPDPTNFSYIDYCSNSHNCFNTSGTSNPFAFIGFQHYATPATGYTTFTLQVATIAAPSCVNDPTYYSGTPKYALYYDSNSASASGSPQNHFLMPPGTKVSTYQGGGTAGSTYVYYCSAGSQATVVNFLVQAMSNVGWTISSAASAGFTATYGSGPTYQIVVSVQNPNNYSLRVFAPM